MSRDARNEAVLCEQHLKIVRALRSCCGREQTSSVITIEPWGRIFPRMPSKPSRTCQESSTASVAVMNSSGQSTATSLSANPALRTVGRQTPIVRA